MLQFNSNKQALRCMAMVALGHGLGIRNPEHITPNVAAMLSHGAGTSVHCGLVAFGFETTRSTGTKCARYIVHATTPQVTETWQDALEMTESEFCRKWVNVENDNSYQQNASLTLRAFSNIGNKAR